MKLRSLLSLLAIAFAANAAQAQVGIYVNPIGIHISNSKPDTGPFAFLGENSTSRTFLGAAIGGYYEVSHLQKIDVGVDLRDIIVRGNGASLNSFLVALRIAGRPVKYGFRPYLQPAVGVGSSRSALNPLHLSKLEYAVYGGVDYPIHRHVDFRVVEVGYGSVLTQNSQNFQGSFAFPSSRLLSFSSGLVFRFP